MNISREIRARCTDCPRFLKGVVFAKKLLLNHFSQVFGGMERQKKILHSVESIKFLKCFNVSYQPPMGNLFNFEGSRVRAIRKGAY